MGITSARDGAPPLYPARLIVLAALSAWQREVIVLRYYADLSQAQIAAAMGISKGAVKAHAARALGSLRAALC